MNQLHLELWKDIHKNLLEIILPILLVVSTLYFMICTYFTVAIIFIGVFYFFITAILRESFWLSDYYTSKVIGYYEMQSFLWSNVERPPSMVTKLRMHYPFVFFTRPAWECRVHRLKRMYGKLEEEDENNTG